MDNPSVSPNPAAAPATNVPATQASQPSILYKLRHASALTKGILAAVLIMVIAAWLYFAGQVSTSDAQLDCHITTIAPQVPGYVVELKIDDNTPVKEGEVLIQIDPREYKARVDEAKSALLFAQAAADSAKLQIPLTRETTTHSTGGAAAQKDSDAADYATSQAQLEQAATANLLQAQANVAAKTATNERAQSDLERYRPLLATGDVSKFQFDAVDAAASVAKSDLDAAQQQLAAAQQAVDIARSNAKSSQARVARSQSLFLVTRAREREVPITEAAYKSAVANVERAKANLELAELNLAYTTIRAPITGQIAQKSVNLGNYVAAGQLACTIVPLREVYVTANFKETQMHHVRHGQSARIHVDTYDREYEGVVDSIAGATGSRQALLPPQNATGNFVKVVQRIPVKILLKPGQDPQLILRPGMNVEATIYTR
jgi:membrane fusion protein (multidrug efflux system)